MIWHHDLSDALAFFNIENTWKVRRTALDAGDVAVVAGAPEGCVIVAVGMVMHTEEMFQTYKSPESKRLFGPGNELETLSLKDVTDGQIFVAYPAWLPPEEYGAIDSLWRDYHPFYNPIMSQGNLAKWIAKFAARYGKEPSKKGVPLKKGISLFQYQRNWIAYATTDAIADALLTKFKTPARIFKILEGCQFTAKAHHIILPKEFEGCGFGEISGSIRLQKFYDLYMKDMTLG